MNSALKFHQENADIDNDAKKIPYRLCCKERIKIISTRLEDQDKIINTTLHEPNRPETREVLRMTKVNSVDNVETKEALESCSCGPITRSVTSMERRATPSLYLPYLPGTKHNITPVFNMATYGGFRTLQERKCLAFARTLERNHKQLFNGSGKAKRLPAQTVIDVSKPIHLQSRYATDVSKERQMTHAN